MVARMVIAFMIGILHLKTGALHALAPPKKWVHAVRPCLFVMILLAGLPVLASDWEEDSRPAKSYTPGQQHDTVILDEPQKNSGEADPPETRAGHGGTVLQGNATAIRTRVPVPPTSSAMAANRAAMWAEAQRLESEARRFLQGAAVNANVPPALFKAFVDKQYPGFLLSAENDPHALVLVRGQWDDSNKPLHSLGLKFDAIKPKELPDFHFDKCKVMIVDCAGVIPRAAVQPLRNFVMKGGYLLTTDWSLQNVIEQAFPGYVQWNRDNTEGVITDAFIMDPAVTLMNGVSGRNFTWKLDRMSQCVRILRPDKVHLIARSAHLAQHDPQLRVLPDPLQAGALAFGFSFGRGKVLHLVGHFDNCSNSFRTQLLPDPAPGIGISLRQALATNFIIEALKKAQTTSPAQAE